MQKYLQIKKMHYDSRTDSVLKETCIINFKFCNAVAQINP